MVLNEISTDSVSNVHKFETISQEFDYYKKLYEERDSSGFLNDIEGKALLDSLFHQSMVISGEAQKNFLSHSRGYLQNLEQQYILYTKKPTHPRINNILDVGDYTMTTSKEAVLLKRMELLDNLNNLDTYGKSLLTQFHSNNKGDELIIQIDDYLRNHPFSQQGLYVRILFESLDHNMDEDKRKALFGDNLEQIQENNLHIKKILSEPISFIPSIHPSYVRTQALQDKLSRYNLHTWGDLAGIRLTTPMGNRYFENDDTKYFTYTEHVFLKKLLKSQGLEFGMDKDYIDALMNSENDNVLIVNHQYSVQQSGDSQNNKPLLLTDVPARVRHILSSHDIKTYGELSRYYIQKDGSSYWLINPENHNDRISLGKKTLADMQTLLSKEDMDFSNKPS